MYVCTKLHPLHVSHPSDETYYLIDITYTKPKKLSDGSIEIFHTIVINATVKTIF